MDPRALRLLEQRVGETIALMGDSFRSEGHHEMNLGIDPDDCLYHEYGENRFPDDVIAIPDEKSPLYLDLRHLSLFSAAPVLYCLNRSGMGGIKEEGIPIDVSGNSIPREDPSLQKLFREGYGVIYGRRCSASMDLVVPAVPQLTLESIGSVLQRYADLDVVQVVDNPQESRRRSFLAETTGGEVYVVKATKDKLRASLDAIAGYFLSKEVSIISSSEFPKPIQVGDQYLTVHKYVSSQDFITRRNTKTPRQWIADLALFHSAAQDILSRQQVFLPDNPLSPAAKEQEKYALIKDYASHQFDTGRYHAARQLIDGLPGKVVTHNDLNPRNIVGQELGQAVDFERIAKNSPLEDIAFVLVNNTVARQQWGAYLQLYATTRGFEPSSPEYEALRYLPEAVYLITTRELNGIAQRKARDDIPAQQKGIFAQQERIYLQALAQL